jgi:hypothetical protein
MSFEFVKAFPPDRAGPVVELNVRHGDEVEIPAEISREAGNLRIKIFAREGGVAWEYGVEDWILMRSSARRRSLVTESPQKNESGDLLKWGKQALGSRRQRMGTRQPAQRRATSIASRTAFSRGRSEPPRNPGPIHRSLVPGHRLCARRTRGPMLARTPYVDAAARGELEWAANSVVSRPQPSGVVVGGMAVSRRSRVRVVSLAAERIARVWLVRRPL